MALQKPRLGSGHTQRPVLRNRFQAAHQEYGLGDAKPVLEVKAPFERLGRPSHKTEIDSLYCDVIMQRREQSTGRKVEQTLAPERAANGRQAQR